MRAFLPKPLPEGALERMVAAAQSASSSSNLQAWSVVAVEHPARKSRLSALAGNQRAIEECPVLLVWLADLARLKALGTARGMALSGLDYLEMFTVAVVDVALAAQNATVALESMGLGAVYIGAIRHDPEAVAAELQLPPMSVAIFGLCVGWPDPARGSDVKPRPSQRAMLHRELYEAAAVVDAARAYDDDLTAFQHEQAMPPSGWTNVVTQRVRGPEALGGRDRLKAALRARGFPLL